MKITIEDKPGFVDDLLNHYLARGFGSLSKSETDTLMMHLLLKYSDLSARPNHDLSLMLQLTEARLKNLRYQARLKYESDHDDFIRREFFKLLEKAELVADAKDSTIQFVVEDSFVKQGIKAKLKAIGHFADHSFNSEVVKIKEGAFIDLLGEYFNADEKNKIQNAAKKAMKKAEDISFNEVMHEFIKGMIRKAGGNAVGLVAAGLSGGLSEVGAWVSGIDEILKS